METGSGVCRFSFGGMLPYDSLRGCVLSDWLRPFSTRHKSLKIHTDVTCSSGCVTAVGLLLLCSHSTVTQSLLVVVETVTSTQQCCHCFYTVSTVLSLFHCCVTLHISAKSHLHIKMMEFESRTQKKYTMYVFVYIHEVQIHIFIYLNV